MTKIYLIRHTHAEGNACHMMQGFWDGGVTELGKKQVKALEARFRDLPIDAVYASDLYRARYTAAAIAGPHGLSLVTDPELRELNIGPWETRFYANLRQEDPERMRQFRYDPEHFSLPGAETFAQVGERMQRALERIARRHGGQTVAVVSHGASIRCFLWKACGLPLADVEGLPLMRNTAVTTLEWEDGRFRLLGLNDYSHISDLSPARTPDLRHEPLDLWRDARYYKDCYRNAWLAAHGNLDGYFADWYLQAAREHQAADPMAVLKLLDGDEPVGLVDLDTRRGASEGWGWLSLLYLKPEYRNRGLGIQLLARAVFHYRRLGRRVLRLNVAEENAPALAFYRREGFRLAESRPDGLLTLEKSLGGPEE